MTGWFDPGLLVQTGIRAAVSTVFGQFADKREAIAAANAIAPTPADGEFDYAENHKGGDFWFDYLADTGDGWNSTYAMARLVTEDEVRPDGSTLVLPRGRLLVLGGDQVYPTATREEYQIRFLGPFDEAYAPAGRPRWKASDRIDEKEESVARIVPHLYAIPGNHDWYDGLNSFFGLFCRRRVTRPGDLGVGRRGRLIAGRRTKQTRSYFAVRLPGNWWLWGTDSQLEGYIDQPQIDYFTHAASHWMDPGSNLIICVADPSWAYVDPKNPEKKFASFCYLERLAGLARRPPPDPSKPAEPDPPGMPAVGDPMGHKLKLVLTGDSHHYARYVDEVGEGLPAKPDRHYIVCGGGGAFLHPTHHLRDVRFNSRFPPPGTEGGEGSHPRAFRIPDKVGAAKEKALFPSARESASKTRRNLGFAWKNWKFTGVLLGAYLLFNWMLDFNARTSGFGNLARALRGENWRDALDNYVTLLVVSPWPVVLMAVALGGYYYFADSPNSASKRLAIGLLHSAWQALVVTATILIVVCWTKGVFPARWDALLSVFSATLASAIVSATAFGAYLFVSLRFFRRHANEGFSSLRIEGFKSFLRLKIAPNGTLSIHPIGLKDVPKDDGDELTNPNLKPHLIEGPITID